MYEFRDATRFARWTQLALIVFVLVVAWALVVDLLQLRLFYAIDDGSYTPAALREAFQSNDARQLVTVPLRLAAYILSGALALEWICRANANARGLGATGLRYTPGWAAAWFFIPFANLVRPYDALAEIWRASAHPQGWSTQREPLSLRWWWVLLLFAVGLGIIAAVSFKFARVAGTVIDATWYTALSDLAGMLAAGFLVRIIGQVQSMQAEHRPPA